MFIGENNFFQVNFTLLAKSTHKTSLKCLLYFSFICKHYICNTTLWQQFSGTQRSSSALQAHSFWERSVLIFWQTKVLWRISDFFHGLMVTLMDSIQYTHMYVSKIHVHTKFLLVIGQPTKIHMTISDFPLFLISEPSQYNAYYGYSSRNMSNLLTNQYAAEDCFYYFRIW